MPPGRWDLRKNRPTSLRRTSSWKVGIMALTWIFRRFWRWLGRSRMKHDPRFAREALPVSAVDKLIRYSMHERPCWRVTRVLGSMLVFDFGERLQKATRRGDAIEVGADQLSVRNVHWRASGGVLKPVTSDHLDGDNMAHICRAFSGARLEGCELSGPRFLLRFSRGLKISLDMTNRYDVESDEELFELRTSSGLSLSLTPGEGFNLRGFEQPRASRAAA